MGCGGSKLEETSDAVRLCRGRCQNLAEATRLRYALADAHSAYFASLLSLSNSLHRFLLPAPSSSPLLALPALRKGDPTPTSPAPLPPPLSNSGHIDFVSSSDDDDGPLHSDPHSPVVHTTTNHHFAKKAPASDYSLTFQQQPSGGEVGQVQFGGDPSYQYPYADPYNSQVSGSFGYSNAYPYPAAYGGGGAGLFGSAVQPPPAPAAISVPQAPPAPPSPPKTSTWDFLNPFEYDSYFQNYTSSRSSRELREEEGIPDLEDEEMEVVKEAYGHEKSKAGPSSSGAGGSVAAVEDGSREIAQEQHYKMQPSNDEGDSREVEFHVVSKNAVGEDGVKAKTQERLQRRVIPSTRSAVDVVQEIMRQFDRARDVGEEVSRMLEVGKLQYHRKKYQVVSSKMRYITPSLSTISSSVPSTFKSSDFSDNASSAYLQNDEDTAMEAGNLSSTLQQLYIWEKKLLDEVKVEEDMRLLHERKSKRLKYLDERGAEPFKIESVRHTVKKLATKMRIAIHFIHSISIKISKLRDDQLWPQLRELIHGLIKMWKLLVECHRSQYQAILEAQSLDAVATYAGREATKELIMELLKWSESFFSWVDTQKSFVKELNKWLEKCLLYEPEETDDGVIPFSPGRLGAPLVFIICNNWAQAIEMISESEVVDAMNAFTTDILFIWKQHHHNAFGHQSMVAPNSRALKNLDWENQEVEKAVGVVNKKRTQVDQGGHSHTRSVILLAQDTKSSSLHYSLQRCFEEMQRFSESALKVYEGLNARCREEEENAKRGGRT